MKRIILAIFVLTSLAFGDYFEDSSKAYQNGDYKKEVELLKKSCDGGNVKSCFNVGAMYYNGQGVMQDEFRAKQFFGKVCNLKLERGCEYYKKSNSQGY